jgi:hypothetical protein
MEEECAMEPSSTDKRIDDLSGRVGRFEDRFDRFEDKVDARFDKLDARFDSWGKIVGGGVITAVSAIVAGVILMLFGV